MGAVLADVVAKLGETTADLTVSDVQVGGGTLCVPERELRVHVHVHVLVCVRVCKSVFRILFQPDCAMCARG